MVLCLGRNLNPNPNPALTRYSLLSPHRHEYDSAYTRKRLLVFGTVRSTWPPVMALDSDSSSFAASAADSDVLDTNNAQG